MTRDAPVSRKASATTEFSLPNTKEYDTPVNITKNFFCLETDEFPIPN